MMRTESKWILRRAEDTIFSQHLLLNNIHTFKQTRATSKLLCKNIPFYAMNSLILPTQLHTIVHQLQKLFKLLMCDLFSETQLQSLLFCRHNMDQCTMLAKYNSITCATSCKEMLGITSTRELYPPSRHLPKCL